MGTEAFGERAERELLATGEHVRKRAVETRDELTSQEAQIARMASDGLSNSEIGERLFISQHTVAYHLRKGFQQARHQLAQPAQPGAAAGAERAGAARALRQAACRGRACPQAAGVSPFWTPWDGWWLDQQGARRRICADLAGVRHGLEFWLDFATPCRKVDRLLEVPA
jgi:DNA-binding CsgD family transcriptional regulator